jgi:hypothetical protein
MFLFKFKKRKMPTWYSARNGNQGNTRNYQPVTSFNRLSANCPWGNPHCMGGYQSACLEACANKCELTAPGVPEPPLCTPNNPNYPNCDLTAPGTPTHNYRLNSAQTNNNQCHRECLVNCPRPWDPMWCVLQCDSECYIAPGRPEPPLCPESDPNYPYCIPPGVQSAVQNYISGVWNQLNFVNDRNCTTECDHRDPPRCETRCRPW